MRCLVTGIAGHLGSSFARWLLENVPGVRIIGVDNLSCGYRENVPDGIDFRAFDFTWDHVPLPPCDYVFHFAAYAAEGLSPFIRSYNYQNNLIATAKVVNYCIRTGVKRLVFTSSMAVYGRGVPPFDEESVCRPLDPYGNAKLAAERDIQIAGEQHELDYCIIRPHNLYGAGTVNLASLSQRTRTLDAGRARRPPLAHLRRRLAAAGVQLHRRLPALPVGRSHAEQASGQIINLGGEKPVTILEAAETLLGVIGRGEIEHHEARHEVKRAFCTVDKSQRLLGYVERTGLREGLERMWTWAQEAWEQYPERRQREEAWQLEIEKGLYSYWREPQLKAVG
jgi:UDP-glucose 4-epimerase